MAEERALQEIRENIISIKMSIENFIDTTDLKLQLQDERMKVANNRIHDLEESITWLWRAICGSLITAGIAFFVK